MSIFDLFILCIVSFLASGLTFFTGFGLGTILLPFFAIWFPVDQAILMTALVHFANNIFKWVLTWKNIDFVILLRFGLPAILGAFSGALLLNYIGSLDSIYHLKLFGVVRSLNPLKIIVGILIMFFGIAELLEFGKKVWYVHSLTIGGLISGFFGGLSGHQGALRSAFLLRYNLPKEIFIATGIAIACLVDLSRIVIYLPRMVSSELNKSWMYILIAMVAAFFGAWLGNKYLKKIQVEWIKILAASGILIIGLLVALGII